jgi:hypothetical protein
MTPQKSGKVDPEIRVRRTPEEESEHRRLKNVKDIIRDELYGAALERTTGEADTVTIAMSDVAKIAKRICRRVMTGPK